jgi:uncharacterized protein
MTPEVQAGSGLEPRAIVAETLDGLGRGDVEAFGRHLADDATWELVGQDYLPSGKLFEGRDAILRDLVALGEELYDLSTFEVDLKNLIAEGPMVVAEFALTATTARGRAYENVDYVLVFNVVGGKIASAREYTNTLYAKRVHFDD